MSITVKRPSSSNKNCWSFCSRRTFSTLSALRKRSFNFEPLRRLRSSTCANAPPFPGFTWSTFTAAQRLSLCSSTFPGRISFPLILGICVKPRQRVDGKLFAPISSWRVHCKTTISLRIHQEVCINCIEAMQIQPIRIKLIRS